MSSINLVDWSLQNSNILPHLQLRWLFDAVKVEVFSWVQWFSLRYHQLPKESDDNGNAYLSFSV